MDLQKQILRFEIALEEKAVDDQKQLGIRAMKKDIDDAKIAKKTAESSYKVKILTVKQFHKFVIGKNGAKIWISLAHHTKTGPSDRDMITIAGEEIKITAQSQIVTKGIDLKTKVSVDASTSPANDSEVRTLLEKEATETEETHKGLYERRRRTKYATEEGNIHQSSGQLPEGGAEQDTEYAGGGGQDQPVAGQREIHQTA